MKTAGRNFWAVVLLMALVGCDPRVKNDIPPPPEGMLDKETFVTLHAELQLLEAAYRQRMLNGGDRDAVRAAHRVQILDAAGVSGLRLYGDLRLVVQPARSPAGPVSEQVQCSSLDSIEREPASGTEAHVTGPGDVDVSCTTSSNGRKRRTPAAPCCNLDVS